MFTALIGALIFSAPAEAVRVKDVGSFYGQRENKLVGFHILKQITPRAIAQRFGQITLICAGSQHDHGCLQALLHHMTQD